MSPEVIKDFSIDSKDSHVVRQERRYSPGCIDDLLAVFAALNHPFLKSNWIED
jgi:hypothetical protein